MPDGAHGDIKPQNVFISTCPHGKVVAKMADFGHSFLPHAGDENVLFRPAKSWPWYAPEYHHRGFPIAQGQKQDAYSFGMLCFWVVFYEELLAEAQNILDRKGVSSSAPEQNRHVYTLLENWKREGNLEAIALKKVTARFSHLEKDILTQLFQFTLACDPEKRGESFMKFECLLKPVEPERYTLTTSAINTAYEI